MERVYTVVVETTSEVPGIDSFAIRVKAKDRTEAASRAEEWADLHDIVTIDIMVFRPRPGWLDF